MNYIDKIRETLDEVDTDLYLLVKDVLLSEEFEYWPAAVRKHHAYWGGLAKHTWQVLRFTLDALQNVPGADLRVAALGAVWHDFGKFRDYNILSRDHYTQELGIVEYTRRASQVGHLTESVIMFRLAMQAPTVNLAVRPTWLTQKFISEVEHVITAHHGRKEWGSPREPDSVEALAVHQADMMSVMVDCGENPSQRGGTEKVDKVMAYKAEDLSPGDILTVVPIGPKMTKSESASKQVEFVRLDKNNCPVVKPVGAVGKQVVFEKAPLRSIQHVTPGPEEPEVPEGLEPID